jgi:hypothetical protein
MAIDTTEIRVGVTGTVYVAPTGTTLPVEPTEALNVAFVELGSINEDGLSLAPERSIEKIRAWQSRKPVRTMITEDDLSISFALQQWNLTNVKLMFGGGTRSATVGLDSKFVPPSAGEVDTRAFIFDWVDDDITYRLVVPQGLVTEVEEIELKKDAAAELGLTVEVLGSSPNDWILYTDDPNLAA